MVRVVPTVCGHDCGGCCPLNAHVEDGRIIRMEAHDVGVPALKPCLKGLLYHYRVYAPDRLQHPLKRAGERGEGKFVRISWDQALSEVARELIRVRDTYGATSIFNLSWTGALGRLHYCTRVSTRFLNLLGGQLGRWGGTSYQGGLFASLATYGRLTTGSDRADLLNSKMIVLWGCNPAESIFATETRWYLTQAKERGIEIVCIDPRYTESAAAWASEWIPVRPGTDAALAAAIAYVIIERGLHDRRFLDKYTVGFDKFKDYVTGAEDGTPKTPQWAEAITGAPAQVIADLAVRYATAKPAAILAGFAPGRTSRGEQYHRATATLSAMTGNVGIHGGSTACLDLTATVRPLDASQPEDLANMYCDFPPLANPAEQGQPPHRHAIKGVRSHTAEKIHPSVAWDAIIRGKAGGYVSDIRLIYNVAGNVLNEFCDVNKAAEAFRKPEFIVMHEQFMTPTAKFADIILPACTYLERNDFRTPWFMGHYALFANKAIEPLYESKSDFDIFNELAHRMGINFSDKTEDEWLREFAARHGIPDYDAFRASGFYQEKTPEPHVGFRRQVEDPEHNRFPTPSGKIEIYCQRLADYNQPDIMPAIPRYLEGWEGRGDPLYARYPLQLITLRTRRRIDSMFDNIPWFKNIEPHEAWLNPVDARARNIKHHDRIKVYNDRGALTILARVTNRIMPGVIGIYEGAWYDPDKTGVDRGGCANMLTRAEYSPGGAFVSNTALVQAERI